MKYILNKTGLLLLAACFSFTLFTACEDEVDPLETNIVDMNGKITNVSKAITEPGDSVVFTGSDLDKVYKIMLNEDIVTVNFKATASELKMFVPSATPLGEAVTVSLFFSGKGLAQRVLKIVSPPQVMALDPIAAHAGDVITLLGRELYLAKAIKLGGVDVAKFEIFDDKTLNVTVPDGFAGGDVVIVTETGREVTAPQQLILGTELLVTNIDRNGNILDNFGPYSNAEGEESSEPFPLNKVYIIKMFDNGSSWGANCDFTLKSMPKSINGVDIDLTKVEMRADIKASKKDMSINFMVGKSHNPPGLWGKTIKISQEWATYVVPFDSLGQGYSGDPITDDPLIPFFQYTMIKWSLPAQKEGGNLGETFTFDNVKFIIKD